MNVQEDSGHISNWLRILLSAFFSRMRFVMIATLCCALAAQLSTYLLPEVYTGGFSILIKSPEFDRSLISDLADISLRPGGIDDKVILDEFHILRSYGLAGAVSESYGVDTSLPRGYLQSIFPEWLSGDGAWKSKLTAADRRDALTNYFLGKLVVTPQKTSDIITVEMRGHDKAFLQKILSLYASEYLNYRNKVWFTQDAQLFFGGQADKSLKEWENLNDDLLQQRSVINEFDPALEKTELEKQMSANLARLQKLRLQIAQQTGQLAILDEMEPQDTITFFNDQTKENRLFWQLKADIGTAKATRQELLKDYMENSPLIQKADQQLGSLYIEHKQLIQSLIRNSLVLLQSEQRILTESTLKDSARTVDLGRSKQRIDVLEKKIGLFEHQYEIYQSKAMSTIVDKSSRNALGTAVRIISPPMVQPIPIWPQRFVLTLIAAMLGFSLSLMAVTAMWMIKDAYRFPEDVSNYLNLPILTSFALEHSPEVNGKSTESIPPSNLKGRGPMGYLPRIHAMRYSLLVFTGMIIAGWIIGTTLWSTSRENNHTVASIGVHEKPALVIAQYGNNTYAKTEANTGQVPPAPATVELEHEPAELDTQDTEETEQEPLMATVSPATTAHEEATQSEQQTESMIEINTESEEPKNTVAETEESVLGPIVNLAQFGSATLEQKSAADNENETANENEPDKSILNDTEQENVSPDQSITSSGKVSTAEPVETAADLKPEIPSITENASTVAVVNPAKKSANRYYIQFGSFQSGTRATNLQRKLSGQGYPARVSTIVSKPSKSIWFSVRADYPNLEVANMAREKFLAKEGIRPVLGQNRK